MQEQEQQKEDAGVKETGESGEKTEEKMTTTTDETDMDEEDEASEEEQGDEDIIGTEAGEEEAAGSRDKEVPKEEAVVEGQKERPEEKGGCLSCIDLVRASFVCFSISRVHPHSLIFYSFLAVCTTNLSR